MKSKELFESKSTNVVVCDVQPEYDKWCNRIVAPLCNFLNNQTGKIYVWFNGQGMSSDEMGDVKNYYEENGLDTEVNDRIIFIEKEYGFLRNWIDGGVPDRIIIKVIRAMVQNKVDYSRLLNLNSVLNDIEQEELNNWEDDGIYFPYWFEVNEIRNMSPFYICGGGKDECLKEIELICNALNIKYKRINNLVY